jgi:hypothetical protein
MLLSQYYNLRNVTLRTGSEIDFYPKAKDRQAWQALPAELRTEIVKEAEKYIGYKFPVLLMSDYLKFFTEDLRTPYMAPYNDRRRILSLLVMAECVEYKGRFLQDIMNAIACICEETSWVNPAHNMTDQRKNDGIQFRLPPKDGDMVDLSAAYTGEVLAWCYYLLKEELDGITPIICKNLILSLEENIINPYLYNDRMWWRSFANNWNIDINGRCIIIAALIMSDEDKLRTVFEKAIKSMDSYLSAWPEDGGCEEGAKYWNGNVIIMDYFEWLRYVSDGQIDCFKLEKLKNMAEYIIHMYAGKGNYATFSDSHMKLLGTGNLIFSVGKYVGNDNIKILGAKMGANEYKSTDGLEKQLKAVFEAADMAKEMEEYKSKDIVFEKSFWYDSIETAVFRENTNESGIYFAVKGGNNEELHNHNDVGNFILFNNSQPVIIDAGIGEYTRTAFSPERYTVWSMNSKYHNLPYIGGTEQKNGPEFKAVNVKYSHDFVSMDIAPAYGDDNIHKWNRIIEFDRENGRVILKEEYQLTEENEIVLNFILCEEPVLEESCVHLPNSMKLVYEDMQVSYEEVENLDKAMKEHWGRVFRLQLKTRGKSGILNYKFEKEEIK